MTDDLSECVADPLALYPLEIAEEDDFGRTRDRSALKTQRRLARQAREALPQQTTFLIQNPSVKLNSSDDELESEDRMRFESSVVVIKTEVGHLFDDVIPEFCSIKAVVRKYEGWKYKFPKEFAQSYTALSIPHAVDFFMRCSFCGWNPTEVSVNFPAQSNLFSADALMPFLKV